MLSDFYVSPRLETIFFLFVLFAILKDLHLGRRAGAVFWRAFQRLSHGGNASGVLADVEAKVEVKRGEESRKRFHQGYLFLSVIITQVVSSTESWKGYKTAITVVNLSLLVYLAYFNVWWRNTLLGFLDWWSQRPERD